ncbi:sugar phosphate isomerase/epimerase family protein [Streptomyces sp. NPDC001941]|uniref:sugar phosphate isomerase/epimerase family protein n=1 Tax=Streptomyces sp. NPDC001941 TaxID=3154659 RepID=UPI003332B94D
MKYAFSTLGVPGMPVADVAALAADTGYQGVELRAHHEEPVHPGLGAADRDAVVREFARADVAVLTVAGYAKVAAPGDDVPVLEELGELLLLARDLGAPYVRVFPGGEPGEDERCDAVAARRLGAAAEMAAGLGVRILLETHDSHRTGVAVSRVLGAVGHRQAGALWDVMHPWLGKEEPETTYLALAPFLGYVQVKDVASREDLTPLPLGAGVLPLRECLELAGPGGWVCWEYEKRWHPGALDLPPLLRAGREHLDALTTGA